MEEAVKKEIKVVVKNEVEEVEKAVKMKIGEVENKVGEVKREVEAVDKKVEEIKTLLQELVQKKNW